MKNRFLITITAIILMIFASVQTAFASEPPKPYITDASGYLGDEEKASLEEKCSEYANMYDADFAIVITDDSEGLSAEDYAAAFYDRNYYNENGIILAICMDIREYSLITEGDLISVFSSSLTESIYDDIYYYMSEGDFYGAGEIFLDDAACYISQHENGAYSGADDSDFTTHLLTALAVGFVISLIVALCLKRQLKTRRAQPYANSYVKEGSFDLKVSHDTFLYSSITKVKVNNSSSSGSSHGGGGGRSF